nr:ATP-binding protein [Jannaschia faecimaris]
MQSALRPAAPEEASTLRTLNAFAVDLISIPNVDDLFWYVARNVVGQLKFIDCVIYQANPEQTMLTQVAALGEKNPYGRTILNPLQIPFGHGITGQVAQTREAVVIEDLLRDKNYIADTQPARSEICVPLIFDDRIVGVIDSEHPEPGAFGAAELEVLITVAAMTSAKLELLAESERSHRRYTDLVQSHAQLTQETNNRKSLEAELANARKLEAIGRLTGGFAHSFNNLLTVISGNLDLAEEEQSEAVLKELFGDAKDAASRGAKLIKDMLAFSQRMHLVPERLSLNDLVARTRDRNGHRLSNEINLELAQDLWDVSVDPIAAEVALGNLILNARDAMPSGGIIRITTDNVTYGIGDTKAPSQEIAPGRYVRLRVIDEGTGIASHVLPRIYDPFYTTKPIGEGTGLGLSMVMGFMQQSKGTVVAQTENPHGTTFELYFPATVDETGLVGN